MADFTRDDVVILRLLECASLYQSLRIAGRQIHDKWPTTGAFYADLADRIEASLPPVPKRTATFGKGAVFRDGAICQP